MMPLSNHLLATNTQWQRAISQKGFHIETTSLHKTRKHVLFTWHLDRRLMCIFNFRLIWWSVWDR